jgi:hypothetical protein
MIAAVCASLQPPEKGLSGSHRALDFKDKGLHFLLEKIPASQ